MNTTEGRDYFLRGHVGSGIHARASLKMRRKMYGHFREHCPNLDGLRVLDLGTTPDRERLDSNCFVRWLLDDGAEVTLCSPEDLSGLSEQFPRATLAPRLTGGVLPFEAGAFDCVFSSAVIEHVGSRRSQVKFVCECQRVGRSVFLTTPNRYHWLEFHTKLPLVHWFPKALHRRLLSSVGLKDWASEEMLNLLGRADLKAVLEEALPGGKAWRMSSVQFLGMPSNLLAWWSEC